MEEMLWEKASSDGSGGAGNRWGHSCNAIRGGKLLYVFGGCTQDNHQSNEFYVFHCVNRTWTEPTVRGIPPIPRENHTCTTVGDNLFIFGGCNERNPLNDLHILDTGSNTWSSPAVRGDCPEAREGHSCALVGKKLFIFGGCGKLGDGDIYYNDFYKFNTETYIWRRVTTFGTPPTKRVGHSCSSYKNRIIVVGGEDSGNRYLSDIYILDIDTLIWCKVNATGELLPPRAGHTTIVFGQKLFVFGGFSYEKKVYDDIYILDIENMIWSKVVVNGEGPSARFYMGGECLDPQLEGVLVFFGGCDENLEPLSDMYFLHTGIVREIEPDAVARPSLRKQLKLKTQEQYLKNPVSSGSNADAPDGLPVSGFREPGMLNIDLNEFPTQENIILKGKKTETFQDGFHFETAIDGAPLRLFFSKRPKFNNLLAETSSRMIDNDTRDVRQRDDGNRRRPLASESNIEVSPPGPFTAGGSQEVHVAGTSAGPPSAFREYNGRRAR